MCDQDTHDERTLIKRMQHEDTESFSPLVYEYSHRLYAYIKRRVKDTEIVKTLSREIWLKVFRAIKNFRGDSAFYSFFELTIVSIYVIMNNS